MTENIKTFKLLIAICFTEFYSYGTLIAVLHKGGELYLTSYWDYSRTTTKWLLEFMRRFVGVDINSKEIRKDLEKGLIKMLNGGGTLEIVKK